MASLTNEKRTELLRSLRFEAGLAEQMPPASIFPVPEHIRALEPEVALIVGDRGAGKTQLKQALVDDRVRRALLDFAPNVHGPAGSATWLDGWPLGTSGPDGVGWRTVAGGDATDGRDLWMGLLVRAAASSGLLENSKLAPVLTPPGANAAEILAGYRKVATEVTSELDSLDAKLNITDSWIFVAYDELDVLAPQDWNGMRFALRGLVSFWASYARRWRRLRPKVFLRSDFYKHHRDVAGADVAKLGANRVELVWSDKNLYGALLKHIMNKRDPDNSGKMAPLALHLQKTVECKDDAVLGRIPQLEKATDAKPFVERIVDRYMGANRQKGLAFRWILDHLRDGNGRVLPRSLMWLVEHAASEELDRPKAAGAHLLHHTSIRRALDKVSAEHVTQAMTHELRWLRGLKERLHPDREVPWTRRELLKLLSNDFANQWSAEGHRPPGNDPEELLTSLLELGVVRARPKDDFDVPDLYLHGLELIRRGGVARK
jgi:hypothetical protein